MRIGHSGYFVAEACEYTNSFLDFFPKVGIILNIGEDHLDFFKDLEDIRHSFRRFAQLLPQDGCLVVNGDIERLEACAAVSSPLERASRTTISPRTSAMTASATHASSCTVREAQSAP